MSGRSGSGGAAKNTAKIWSMITLSLLIAACFTLVSPQLALAQHTALMALYDALGLATVKRKGKNSEQKIFFSKQKVFFLKQKVFFLKQKLFFLKQK
jgi:hypothetical protein